MYIYEAYETQCSSEQKEPPRDWRNESLRKRRNVGSKRMMSCSLIGGKGTFDYHLPVYEPITSALHRGSHPHLLRRQRRLHSTHAVSRTLYVTPQPVKPLSRPLCVPPPSVGIVSRKQMQTNFPPRQLRNPRKTRLHPAQHLPRMFSLIKNEG